MPPPSPASLHPYGVIIIQLIFANFQYKENSYKNSFVYRNWKNVIKYRSDKNGTHVLKLLQPQHHTPHNSSSRLAMPRQAKPSQTMKYSPSAAINKFISDWINIEQIIIIIMLHSYCKSNSNIDRNELNIEKERHWMDGRTNRQLS